MESLIPKDQKKYTLRLKFIICIVYVVDNIRSSKKRGRQLALSTTIHAQSNRACTICNFVVLSSFSLFFMSKFYCIRKRYCKSTSEFCRTEQCIKKPISASKVKLAAFFFGRATFSCSIVQPPFFPLSLCYIRKLAFVSPWGNFFTPGFVCSQHTTARNIKLAQTTSSQGTNSHLG